MKLEEQELLSVIIPIYNVEAYLSRCLDSIINQTYSNLEIICVDDGSTDQSGAIAEEYAKRDSRIKVIHKENGGLVSARKTGILNASGGYATYVDSDDWIEQGMYEELMILAVNEDADIVTSGDIRDYGTYVVEEPEYEDAGVYRDERLLQLKSKLIATDYFFRKNISIHIYDKIFNKVYLQTYQLRINDQISVGEDAAVVYPALLNAKCCVVSGKKFYHYCLRDNSVMGTRKSNDLETVKIMLDQLKKDFEDVLPCIPNAMKQFKMLNTYVSLLRNVDEVIKYENNVLFPFGFIQQNTRVAIYGAGKFGNELKSFFDRSNTFQVVAIFDKVPRQDVLYPSEIRNTDYDVIIIAALIFDVIENIKKELHGYGVREEQMLYIDANVING